MIKYEVDPVMCILEGYSFLPGFETKSPAQFDEKCLEVIDDGLFHAGLYIAALFLQT
jgi:hypothetical protein